LDFRAVSHVKTDATEDAFHPLPGLEDGGNAAKPPAPPAQSDIDGLSAQEPDEIRMLQFRAAGIEQRFNLLLELVDACALLTLAFWVQRSQPLEQRGQGALLAQKPGFCVLERARIVGLRELFFRLNDQIIDLGCHFLPFQMQTEPHGAPFADQNCSADQEARAALACWTTAAKPALSFTAISASTLRSSSV